MNIININTYKTENGYTEVSAELLFLIIRLRLLGVLDEDGRGINSNG